MRQKPPKGLLWAADNGRFASPEDYSDGAYLLWLMDMPRDTCLFATAPDVVGDAAATLALSMPMFEPIRDCGYAVALVAQDGLETLPVPWDAFDALFVGGTTAWKLSEAAAELVGEARLRGKWCHMGRVNSYKRLRFAESIGCHSADGTLLKYGLDINRPKLDDWLRRIQRQPLLRAP